MSRMNIGRILLVIGLLIGWESLFQTFNHVGDSRFMISPDHPGGIHHAWYHALREAFGDIGIIGALLLIFFASARNRTPIMWWAAFLLMVGYYAPFWAGMPFIPELRAPTFSAEFRHILQAAFALIGLFIVRPFFFGAREAAQQAS